jgi:3-deoxy-D-manno-octulosonic-acid transferase
MSAAVEAASWRERLARGAWGVVLGAMAPLYGLRLLWRSRAEPPYRHAIGQRFGYYGALPVDQTFFDVWVHAVSLGETRAAAALVDALRRRRPGLRLLLTHSTATGLEAGRALLRAGDAQTWLPYDTPGAVRRFLAQWRPRVGVLMETEVWPNLQHAAQAAGVPMVLANARLSERSLRRGQRMAALLRPAARSISLALAQTAEDARRLREAGVGSVEVMGNLKFDITPDAAALARGKLWLATGDSPVVMGAVTREGEEQMLLAAWRDQLAHSSQATRLLVVPRHPQRFDEVAQLIERAGFSLSRRSSWTSGVPDVQALHAQVWLGDSLGEMAAYYAASSVALLGGSFAPLGGQNLIEAAACGCPVVMGPHTFNFAAAAELSIEAGAALRVSDMPQGVREALRLVSDPERRALAASDALGFAAAHRGAAQRMADRILAMA